MAQEMFALEEMTIEVILPIYTICKRAYIYNM